MKKSRPGWGAPPEAETGFSREAYSRLSRKEKKTLQEMYSSAGNALPAYIAKAIDYDIEDEYEQIMNTQKRYEEDLEVMAHGYAIDVDKSSQSTAM